MSGQTCFVVMGYGIKKLPGTFIKLNLDDIYFNFIKPVIEACGLESLYAEQAYRGDEVPTTISINKNFIESLFLADIVIADISTLNQNAIYELGLRHAMKPKSTIIMCEEETIAKYPFFDISMLPQIQYQRKKILSDTEYKADMYSKLKLIIQSCQAADNSYIDSPVFDLSLYEIKPLAYSQKNPKNIGVSLRELILKAEDNQENLDFSTAEQYYNKALKVSFDLDIFSQYILCRYKKDLSIKNLTSVLEYVHERIDLSTTIHENLLGITAAIHKNIFDQTAEPFHLEQALRYYKNGSNFEGGNLYCARNYCALLLKRYKVTDDIESILEYYYTAVHFAKTCLNEAINIHREETDFDDVWYNENLKDLNFIALGIKDSFTKFRPVTQRQKETVTSGRVELQTDYFRMKEIIKGK